MKIVVAGATGFVGKYVCQYLQTMGMEIIKIGRNDLKLSDYDLMIKMASSNVVINLIGSPILTRWTKKSKKEIIDSRVNNTLKIVSAISLMTGKPDLLINASAIGIYPSDEVFSEVDNINNNGFLGDVCEKWEIAANSASLLKMRVIVVRLGIVLGRDGGMIKQLLPIFKKGVGGKIGSGKQYMSFIHINDLVRAMWFLIHRPEISGPVNFVSPQWTANEEFTNALAKRAGKKAIFTIPKWILRVIYGKASMIITDSNRIIPQKLMEAGFCFAFPDIGSAINDLVDN